MTYPPDKLLPNSRTQAFKEMMLVGDILTRTLNMELDMITFRPVKKLTWRERWILRIHRMLLKWSTPGAAE